MEQTAREILTQLQTVHQTEGLKAGSLPLFIFIQPRLSTIPTAEIYDKFAFQIILSIYNEANSQRNTLNNV